MLKLNMKKEIGELCVLALTIIIGIVLKTGFWIGLVIFVVLEFAYLIIYGAIEKKAEAKKPKAEEPAEEINFHEYDDEKNNGEK